MFKAREVGLKILLFRGPNKVGIKLVTRSNGCLIKDFVKYNLKHSTLTTFRWFPVGYISGLITSKVNYFVGGFSIFGTLERTF